MNKYTEITITSYDKTADDYTSRLFINERARENAEIFRKLVPRGGILDVGCGPGRDALYFTENDYEVVGVDLSEAFLKIGRKKAPKAEFLKMDMRELAFADASFDGVWVTSSLLHIPKDEVPEVLSGFYRILKRDGGLFVSVKVGAGERLVKREHYKGERFFAYWSKKDLSIQVEKAGFKVQKSNIQYEYTDGKITDRWINIWATK